MGSNVWCDCGLTDGCEKCKPSYSPIQVYPTDPPSPYGVAVNVDRSQDILNKLDRIIELLEKMRKERSAW